MQSPLLRRIIGILFVVGAVLIALPLLSGSSREQAFTGVQSLAGAFSATPAPTLQNVRLVLTVNGSPARGAVTVPKGSNVTIGWTSQGKGCVNNWDENTSASNSAGTSDVLNANRKFVITCYGIGAAQTTQVQVNVGQPDLIVTNFTATATPVPPVPGQPAVRANPTANPPVVAKPAVPAVPNRNTYYAGTAAITFKAVVRNSGTVAIPAGTAVKVNYQAAQTNTKTTEWSGMQDVSLTTTAELRPGQQAEAAPYAHTAGAGGPWYFRAVADSGGAVTESKEDNNTKVIPNPFIFKNR